MTKKKCKNCKWWIAPLFGYLGECNSWKHRKRVIPYDLPGDVYTFKNYRRCKDWEAKV